MRADDCVLESPFIRNSVKPMTDKAGQAHGCYLYVYQTTDVASASHTPGGFLSNSFM